MEISKEKAHELRELVEDTIEYFCDNERVSGELAWTMVECLAIASKLSSKGWCLPDGSNYQGTPSPH